MGRGWSAKRRVTRKRRVELEKFGREICFKSVRRRFEDGWHDENGSEAIASGVRCFAMLYSIL